MLRSAVLYEPSKGAWSASGSDATARDEHTATLLPNGRVFVAAGKDNSGNLLASAELYNPATGAWSAIGSLANARYFHTATLLPNGKVLIAGGYNEGQLASAELYNSILPVPSTVLTGRTNGLLTLSFTNVTGATFTVLTSTNPALPMTNWTSLGAPTELSPGQFQFTDPQATTNAQRFYRVRSPCRKET